MSHTNLKILALIFMTIDHIGVCIPNTPIWLRWIGRLSAPLFFLCAAESMRHTSDKKNYLKRLWKASIIMVLIESVVPPFLEMYFKIKIYNFNNNIFLSLFSGVFIIYLLEITENDKKMRQKYLSGYCVYQIIILCVSIVIDVFDIFNLNLPILRDSDRIIFTLLGSVWHIEGNLILTASIILFYFCRENKRKLCICYILYCIAYFAVFVPQLGVHIYNALQNTRLSGIAAEMLVLPLNILGIPTMPYETAETLFESVFFVNYQWMMLFSLPFLIAYNGNRGKKIKKIFYIYYPIHLIFLHILGVLI